jgi:hypothetical protein
MLRESDGEFEPISQFIIENFPFIYGNAYDQATLEYGKVIERQIDEFVFITWIILGLLGICTLLVGSLLLAFISGIFRRTRVSIAALMAVPKSQIQTMSNAGNQNIDVWALAATSGGPRQSAVLQDVNGQNENNIESEERNNNADHASADEQKPNVKAKVNAMPAWIIMLLCAFGLLTTFALFCAMSASSYFYTLASKQSVKQMNLLARAPMYILRTAYATHMMAENDVFSYPDPSILKKPLSEDLNTFSEIHPVLLSARHGKVIVPEMYSIFRRSSKRYHV